MEKVESADNLFVFWAKLLRGRVTPETAQTFHPLLCHMTDVAEVTRLMWRETLSPAARRRAQAALNLPDEEAAERWIVFFAGLHDLGKAGPVFTLQEAASRLSQFYQGLPGPPLRAADAYHGIVTAAELPEILAGEDFRLPLEVARRVAAAVGGHHGTIPTSDQVSKAADAAGGIKWKRIRTRIARAVADALEVPRALVPRTLDNAAAMWLAGLVSVADWIGSDERFFEYRVRRFNDLGRLDLTEYRAHAATQARLALSQLGWLGWQPRNVQASFATLFP
ncbi:MAG: CRISPR-associated endonuclease Cas3'', partial [Pyrinomonadaceae bacterium]